MRGNWWRTFGILALGSIMMVVPMWIAEIPLMFLAPQPSTETYGPYDERPASLGEAFSELYGDSLSGVWTYLIVSMAIMMVLQLLAQAFIQLVTALLYIDQRIRREGLGDSLARAAADGQ